MKIEHFLIATGKVDFVPEVHLPQARSKINDLVIKSISVETVICSILMCSLGWPIIII